MGYPMHGLCVVDVRLRRPGQGDQGNAMWALAGPQSCKRRDAVQFHSLLHDVAFAAAMMRGWWPRKAESASFCDVSRRVEAGTPRARRFGPPR